MMRKKIVFQLFSLTFLLCCMIIATIFFGQMYVMKYMYVDKEKRKCSETIKTILYILRKNYKQDENKLQSKELSYANQQGIMIARLDEVANIKKLPSGDYYIKATDKNNPSRISKVVFNNLINAKRDMDSNFSILIDRV